MTVKGHETPTLVPAGFCRVGPLCSIPDLLMRFGCDVTTVLSQAGTSPDVFKHPDQTISYPVAGRLLEHCFRDGLRTFRITGRPGLQFSKPGPRGGYSPRRNQCG